MKTTLSLNNSGDLVAAGYASSEDRRRTLVDVMQTCISLGDEAGTRALRNALEDMTTGHGGAVVCRSHAVVEVRPERVIVAPSGACFHEVIGAPEGPVQVNREDAENILRRMTC